MQDVKRVVKLTDRCLTGFAINSYYSDKKQDIAQL